MSLSRKFKGPSFKENSETVKRENFVENLSKREKVNHKDFPLNKF